MSDDKCLVCGRPDVPQAERVPVDRGTRGYACVACADALGEKNGTLILDDDGFIVAGYLQTSGVNS